MVVQERIGEMTRLHQPFVLVLTALLAAGCTYLAARLASRPSERGTLAIRFVPQAADEEPALPLTFAHACDERAQARIHLLNGQMCRPPMARQQPLEAIIGKLRE